MTTSLYHYAQTAALSVEADAYDEVWAQKEADASDTLEWKVPAILSFADGTEIIRPLRHELDQVIHPITGVAYTIRQIDQEGDQNGNLSFHYVAEAPHYDLGWIPAVPFTSELGTSPGEMFACLERVAGGWTFSGDGCGTWEGDGRCPEMSGPNVSSDKASVLGQLFVISSTWGGRWRFDEAARRGYLECGIGPGSGVVADWKTNLLLCKRTQLRKPNQQVLVQEADSGVLSGTTAAMALAELMAQDACDDYLQQKADQLQQATVDPCTLSGGPSGPVTWTKVKTNALRSGRAYAYEAFLLSQGPAISYAVTAIDESMVRLGAPGPAEVGQWMRVVHGELGISDAVRVVGRALDILQPERTTYELSTEVPWMAVSILPQPLAAAGSGTSANQAQTPSTPTAPGPCVKKGPGQGDDCVPCAPDPRGILASWIPPPTCVGQGEKLKIALADRIACLNALLGLAASMSIALDGLNAALQGLTGIPLSNDAGFGANQNVQLYYSADDLFAAVGETRCRLAQAILEAQLQVVEAEARIANAQAVLDSAPDMQRAVMSCDPTTQKAGMTAAKAASAAVAAADKGHWEYSLRQAAVQPAGCPSGCQDPTAPTTLGAGSPLDTAAGNVIAAVCNFTRTTLPTITKHSHESCGDVTVDTSFGGSQSDPKPASVDKLTKDTAAQTLALWQANELLKLQIKNIQDADAAIEKLHDNTKECSSHWAGYLGAVFAGCAATSTPPKPGALPPQYTPMQIPGWFELGPGEYPPPIPVTDPGYPEPPGAGAGQHGVPTLVARAEAVASLAQAGQTVLPGVLALVQKLDDMHSAAEPTLTAPIVLPPIAPGDEGPDGQSTTWTCDPPDWGLDVGQIGADANALRTLWSQMAADAGLTAKVAGELGPILDGANTEDSRATDGNDPQTAIPIRTQRDALRDRADPFRIQLGANVSAVLDEQVGAVAAADALIQDIDDAIDAAKSWMSAVGNFQPPVPDPVYDALLEFVDYPGTAASLREQRRLLQGLRGQLAQHVAFMRSEAAEIDGQIVTAGRDQNHQVDQNELTQNAWIANTQATRGNSYDGFQYDRIYHGAAGAQRISVGPTEPDGPHNVDDIWIQTEESS